MSRLRRMEENKKKNNEKLKSTIIGLSAAILIGVTGGVGSYAYFSDKAQANNDLVITMGNIDTEFDNNLGLDLSLDKQNKVHEQSLTIVNKGSLNQNLKLSFNYPDSKDIAWTENLKTTLKIELKNNKSGSTIELKNTDINNFKQLITLKNMPIRYEDGSLVSLDNDSSIVCTVSVDINGISDESILETLQNRSLAFGTTVEAEQINTKGADK